MVEILLNFFWLTIAMAIVIGTTLCPRLRGRRGTAVAATCLVAILFPIISITDDLSPAREAIEEARPGRRGVVSAGLADRSSASVHPSFFPAALPAVLLLLALTVSGSVLPWHPMRRTLLVDAAAAPRSPPFG